MKQKETLIALSPHMTEVMRNWFALGNKLDPKLLFECAYYPRGGCTDCDWDAPNPACKYSHILIDTRIAPFEPRKKILKNKTSIQKRRAIALAKLLALLPDEAQAEVESVIFKVKGGENK